MRSSKCLWSLREAKTKVLIPILLSNCSVAARESGLAPFKRNLGTQGRKICHVPRGGEILEILMLLILLLHCNNG